MDEQGNRHINNLLCVRCQQRSTPYREGSTGDITARDLDRKKINFQTEKKGKGL